MRRVAAALALLALLAPQRSAAEAQGAREMVLNLPRPIGVGETAFIEVEIGALGRGQSVEIATAEGRSLGAISPFGVLAGQNTGTYTVPVPPDAIRDGRIALRFTITQGDASRPATTEEVRGVRLSIVGAR